MIHPIPPGTRDILPDEMRELRELQATLIELFERYGYGQVATPTLEYDEVLQRGEGRGGGGAYRFFDERGELLALRSDMTIPIARLAATRFADDEPPLRFSYVGNAYRVIRPQRAQVRQFMHAGIELLGSPAPEGTAEVLEVLSASLDAVGLNRAVLGLGDADLYRQLLTELGVEDEGRVRILDRLAEHDLVGLEVEVGSIEGLDATGRETLLRLPGMRGGEEVLDLALELGGAAVERAAKRLRATYDALVERGVASRVQLDLGLLRDLGYYTGAIVEIYDPALGHIVGGGGRYDDVLGRFGRSLPAAGFGLYLERVHLAQMEEERIRRGRTDDARARDSATRSSGEERPVS
jgi:ATP phosphoribosyltransferase regulatory subunit